MAVPSEAFGQAEPLTRRLRNILELYPEGAATLHELTQNADDAGATTVRFLFNMRSYGCSSLLSPKMADWQGPSLCVYNDALFTAADFANLARIGQGSKLEKLATTGQFLRGAPRAVGGFVFPSHFISHFSWQAVLVSASTAAIIGPTSRRSSRGAILCSSTHTPPSCQAHRSRSQASGYDLPRGHPRVRVRATLLELYCPAPLSLVSLRVSADYLRSFLIRLGVSRLFQVADTYAACSCFAVRTTVHVRL
jgi:hypothetical protein